MAITRRDFLKYTAVAGAALYLGIFDLKPIKAYAQSMKPEFFNEAPSVGPYCSGGCGIIVGTAILPGLPGEYVTYVQGNPDSPINGGGLCSKCASSAQISTIIDNDPLSATYGERVPNPKRITQPYKRANGAAGWTPISWAQAISEIAAKVKASRDATFIAEEGGITVNRCESIATLGGSSLNNEPAYLISKLNRALGIVYMETQARN